MFSYWVREGKKKSFSTNTSVHNLLGFLIYQIICVFPPEHASHTSYFLMYHIYPFLDAIVQQIKLSRGK